MEMGNTSVPYMGLPIRMSMHFFKCYAKIWHSNAGLSLSML